MSMKDVPRRYTGQQGQQERRKRQKDSLIALEASGGAKIVPVRASRGVAESYRIMLVDSRVGVYARWEREDILWHE